MVDLLADQIAGYYDSKTKKLTILDTAGSDAAWAEMVLAHELDHGLQDQAFDLEKFEKLPDDDTRRAHRAPRARRRRRRRADDRGDARARGRREPVVGARGRGSGDPGDVDARRRDQATRSTPRRSRSARRCCSRIATGFAFVAALRRTKPWSAIDAAFAAAAAVDRADHARRQVPRRRQADRRQGRGLAAPRLRRVDERRRGASSACARSCSRHGVERDRRGERPRRGGAATA